MTIFPPPPGSVTAPNHQAQAQQLARLHRPKLRTAVRKWLAKVYSFFVAVTSPLWKKRLSNAQYEARLAACLGCSSLNKAPGAPLGFCNACGCKKSKLAELTVKANLPGAKCPEGKWASSKALPKR